jgi:hypothetical protein
MFTTRVTLLCRCRDALRHDVFRQTLPGPTYGLPVPDFLPRAYNQYTVFIMKNN